MEHTSITTQKQQGISGPPMRLNGAPSAPHSHLKYSGFSEDHRRELGCSKKSGCQSPAIPYQVLPIAITTRLNSVATCHRLPSRTYPSPDPFAASFSHVARSHSTTATLSEPSTHCPPGPT